ncbi:SRPBCC family protein [Amycolatopsis rubida]|uniref:SRPBCC family protein n=2 Tax=Pseudonocardiaceae TaxID=2070 RepID=A0ABX0BT89_9PSEU|nr:SRPBCC family protein [Amycolatopsis rubida]NEC57620.1 SRPBCC family protein [Amycolatopsis rubida]
MGAGGQAFLGQLMAALRSHVLLDAPADAVWRVIGDPAAVADWFPSMKSSTGDTRHRTVVLGDGSVLEEAVVTHDPARRRLQYRVTGGDLPVAGHLGTVDVLEIDAGRSIVVYSTEISPDSLAGAFDAAISEAVAALPAHLS